MVQSNKQQQVALTARQRKALSSAAPAARQQLASHFRAQNSRRQRMPANLARMPAPSSQKGVMPDLTSAQVWGQTPASSNVIAPRGFGYYDAFAHNAFETMTYSSIGPATPITATTLIPHVYTVSEAGDGSKVAVPKLVVIYPATDGVQARTFEFDASAPITAADAYINVTDHRSPQLDDDAPENAIPTRCSFRIRNITQQLAVGGVVRVLRLTTGIALEKTGATGGIQTTNAELAALMDGIRTHERTRTYGGCELIDAHQKNCTVVDQARATMFAPWGVNIKAQELPWTNDLQWDQGARVAPFAYQTHDPSYTPIALLFEPFAHSAGSNPSGGDLMPNIYEISIRSQFLAHYTQGRMLANQAVTPATDAQSLTKLRDREEVKGSVLEKLSHGIQAGASWAWNHRSEIAPFVGTARTLAGALRYAPKFAV